MSRVKTSLDHKRIRCLIWLVLTVSVLLGYSVQSVAGSAYYSMVMQAYGTVSSPPVILEEGTAGSSTIYTNKTSAKVSAVAPAPTPTYYPNLYNIPTGTHVSGIVPPSVQTVDASYFIVRSSGTATSTTAYNPSNYSLLGSTTLFSGATADLVSNNSVYMTFKSYASATSAQTLYAHQETTTIGGNPYYLQKLVSADNGTTLSVSMAATGRQLMGKFIYPLTGASSINASTWTMYYRAWRDAALANIAFDAQSSIVQTTTVSSISWNHTTGTGSNRLLLVAVATHKDSGAPKTVTSVTYDGVSLTQVTTALYSATQPQVRTYVFQLVNPASGTKPITVNFGGNTLSIAGAVTYTGVDQITPIQTSNTAAGSGTAPSVSVTVTGSGRWVFGHLGGHTTASAWTITEGAGQTQRWAQTGQLYKGVGSDKSVSAGSQSMSWSLDQAASYVVSAIVINPATLSPVGHVDVDVLIRQSNGTIRTTIATNVANSGDLTSIPTTLLGTYSWAAYIVEDQTDYLEIDCYVEVTTAVSGTAAYVRIDDSTLPTADQTRADNIILPSEFTSEVEFTGASNTYNWAQLNWTADSAWTTDTVAVTLQLYNYTLGAYPTSGNGYISYTSSATADTDETKTQTITINPQHFRNATGYWKINVKGEKSTTVQFDFKADWIEFKPSHYAEYTVSTEFMFSSMTANTPTQLNFTVVSEYDIASVSVTIQVWNYSSSAYVTGGEGYLTYTSSGSNETQLLSININPQFYTSNGEAKIKITGVLATTTQYQQEINQVKLLYSYSSSSTYDYVLKVVNQVADNWTVNLQVYDSSNIDRLSSLDISLHDGTSSNQIAVSSGSIIQSEGPPYNLAGNATIYISMSNLQATTTSASYLYVHLKIQVPNTSTYILYVITFEII